MYRVKNIKELEKATEGVRISFLGRDVDVSFSLESDIYACFRRVSDNGWMKPFPIPKLTYWEKMFLRDALRKAIEYTARVHLRYGSYEIAGRILLWMARKNEDFVLDFMDYFEFEKQDFVKKTSHNSNLKEIYNFATHNTVYVVIRDVKNDMIIGVFKFGLKSRSYVYSS